MMTAPTELPTRIPAANSIMSAWEQEPCPGPCALSARMLVGKRRRGVTAMAQCHSCRSCVRAQTPDHMSSRRVTSAPGIRLRASGRR